MGEKKFRRIPRWLFAEDVVVTSDWLKLPPEVFRNDTIWPFHLEYLSISGFPVYADGDSGRWWGGCGHKLDVEIGFSGISDINIVSALASAVCSHTQPGNLQLQRPIDVLPLNRKLRYPYRLPRDSGFVASCRYNQELLGTDQEDFENIAGPNILFHGVDIVTGAPVQLGCGRNNQTYSIFDEIPLGNADMFNRGIHDVDITDVTFMVPEIPRLDFLNYATRDAWKSGLFHRYLVNPIIGERWMPGSTPIPIAHLAPLTTEGTTFHDLGPQTYFFPEGTYLHRRQQMGLRIENNDDTNNQAFSVALFGYLEVQ